MKNSITLIICSLLFLNCYTQNNFSISANYGYGNTVWGIKPIEFSFHDIYGNTDTTVFIYTSSSDPCYAFQISGEYAWNKAIVGLSAGMQHFYVRNLIYDGIPALGIPTIISPVANPTPTHYKFGVYGGYTIAAKNNITVTPYLQLGTFIDDYVSDEEGFHWYFNTSMQFAYLIADNFKIYIQPSYDYSRWNSNNENNTDDQKIWIDIYSFTTSFGVSYIFGNKKLSE
ncbi:MAG: hypothetical protein IPN31_15405 [Bacteroidetes bacterium]|nr:hypothetical protein [Bacteroidota bacterium]